MQRLLLITACLTSLFIGASSNQNRRNNLQKFISFKNLADAEHKQGKLLNAINHYSEAINIVQSEKKEDKIFDENIDGGVADYSELEPSLLSCRLSLALCQLKQGEYCKSMQQCTRILQTVPRPHPEVIAYC
jgi:tetratricopeptide (TPR) repeat protein